MSDHDLDARLRSWARSTASDPTPAELRHGVLGIPDTEAPTERRHRRWLPGPKPTAGADGRRDQTRLPAPTTTNGIGGTRSMFSATKLFAMAASIALLGGLTLALPLTPQEGPEPLAVEAPEPGEISSFTGSLQLLGQDQIGSAEQHDWGSSTSGEQWSFRLTTTDPRYSGLGTSVHNIYALGPDRTALRAQTGRLFTEEEDGTWLSTGYSYQDPETTGITYVINSTGEGSYAGLSAYSVCGQAERSLDMECHGIVFEGDWPELPNQAPTELDSAYGTP